MINLWLAAGPIVAELIGLDQVGGETKVAAQAGQVTLTWVIGVLIALAILVVAFKKSRRTHLD
ncbi:MAG: hypothetical protein PHU85_16585 [Phycisphaerae bacterium]|nr:hypothetical protein [Phycisphaerae bacterium]